MVCFINLLANAQETVLINSTNIEKEDQQVLIEADIKLIESLTLSELDIYSPSNLTVNSKGDIALMAWSTRKIFFFEDGKLQKPVRLKSSEGRGPGEYEAPFDMYLTDERMIWVSDFQRRKIDRWDPLKNKVTLSHTISEMFVEPDHLVECYDGGKRKVYTVSVAYGPTKSGKVGLFHSFLVEGDELIPLNTFQQLSEKDERRSYVVTGDIACGDDPESIFYAGSYSSTIRKYINGGELSFYRNSVDTDLKEPIFIKTSKTTTRINPKAPKVNNGVFNAKGKLIVVTSNRIHDYSQYLDFYDKDSGAYEFSVTLPALAREVVLNDNNLVAIEGVETEEYVLKVYKFEIPD
jgi:hypothetical protein